MNEKLEIPKEESLKVVKAIGTKRSLHRLAIWRKVKGRLKPSFNAVMDHLTKIGAILEVSDDTYLLHPVFSVMEAEVGIRACYPLVKQQDGKGVTVWTASH